MRLQDIPMQRKLVHSFLLAGCIPAVLLAVMGLLVAGTSLTTQTYQQLTGLRENKQQQLETYFAQQQSDLAVIGKTVESFQIAAESKLAAIRDAKQVALQEYLQTIKAQSIDLAKNKLIVESMWALPNFFRNYIPEQNLEEADLNRMREELRRYWENEFKQIKPKIFSGKRRYYDKNTINILKNIKFLIKEKGMTIKGVKKLLVNENSKLDEIDNRSINAKNILKNRIKNISRLVKEIKKID